MRGANRMVPPAIATRREKIRSSDARISTKGPKRSYAARRITRLPDSANHMRRSGVSDRNSLNMTSCSARATAESGFALPIDPQIRSRPDSALRTTSSIQSGAA
jgi:hypothetical protein